jgi:glycine/D-amino acid oxidase-like deaminating enzyme
VGGGFFGCSIAKYMKKRVSSVLLLEREPQLFMHASYANQARIHNGYHYPRSLQTAYRSRVNFPRFLQDFSDAVVKDFTALYCVADPLSNVTPKQFERFCDIIGAPWKPARAQHARLFDPRLIAAVYEVMEYAFNSDILREMLKVQLDDAGVEIRLQTSAVQAMCGKDSSTLSLSDGSEVETTYLFNCTYAGLKQVPGLKEHCHTELKQEITEMALIEPPEELNALAVTVMCGPFFSMVPFPPRGLNTLSHVRYTPRASWIDSGEGAPDPYVLLAECQKTSKAELMLRDAARYLPVLRKARIRDSLFEVKTLLMRNEVNDGRPILVERSGTAPNVYSIMGGKIDNIYDVYAKLGADGL